MRLVIAPAALTELEQATEFYRLHGGSSIGSAFVDEFERCAALLLSNPFLGSLLRGSLRQLPFRRFPYKVIYRVSSKEIRVLALAHQRRRPGYWAKRK